MAARYIVEHKQMQEQAVDRIWNATWKWSLLIVYYLCLLCFGVTALKWLWRQI